MPAPLGNQYYKLRNKDGRDKIFSNPDEIIELAKQYLDWCEENPIYISDFIKSGPGAGTIVKIPKQRIPTKLGFCVFIGISTQTMWNYENDGNYKDFFDSFNYVCEQFASSMQDGAILGAANPMIAARILGLKEKQEITGNTDLNLTVNLSKDEARRLSDQLENDI